MLKPLDMTVKALSRSEFELILSSIDITTKEGIMKFIMYNRMWDDCQRPRTHAEIQLEDIKEISWIGDENDFPKIKIDYKYVKVVEEQTLKLSFQREYNWKFIFYLISRELQLKRILRSLRTKSH